MLALWTLGALSLCVFAQELAPAWAPVEVQAEGAVLRLHLVHWDVQERVSVGDEVWELLESGVVARRGPDGALLGHFLDCRVSDLVGDLRLCEDGRVLSPTGEVGRFAPSPTLATPWQGGLVAQVKLAEGVAIQRLGQAPLLLQQQGEGDIHHLLAFEGRLYGVSKDVVFRLDPATAQIEPLVLTPFHARRLVDFEGELQVLGTWAHGEYGACVVPVPDPADPGGQVDPSCATPGRSPGAQALRAPKGTEIPGELDLEGRELLQTRWGLAALPVLAPREGGALLGAEGWAELPGDSVWVPGPGGELFGLRGQGRALLVSRWTGSTLEEQLRLPAVLEGGRDLNLDRVFLGPDGRWWGPGPDGEQARAWDGRRWVDLGFSLPVYLPGLRALDQEHLYSWAHQKLWRWSPARLDLVAERVAVGASPEGLLVWDGHALRRGDELLLEDPTLKISRVAQDGCGRIWLMGEQVVVLEGGRAVPVMHPLLEGSSWAYGDATGEGAILSDGRMVVEVVRACPG